ncbi:Zinc finger protein AZF2 [Morella rubra]|uniref:Zinc finger protein AZF2 n=1 Tax=Morella rubra TaxID=262757 RepID=A0A6A1VQ08_9ROSI|nr:Zinc finger protein AZF2 [Morella rubra]
MGENTTGIGTGKLCIKLRIPKAEEVDNEYHLDHPPATRKGFSCIKADSLDHVQEQERDPPAAAKYLPARICNRCDKVFASGKALGGHMRMHVQARRKKELLKPNLKKKAAAADDLSTVMVEPTCSVCGKKFSNMKALFGHMRSHPSRTWRGIRPPPVEKTKASSSSSTLSDDGIGSAAAAITATKAVVVDFSGPLFCWKVTGKRGRKSIGPSTNVSDSGLPQGLEEGMQEAVYDLMMLSNASSKKIFSDNSEPEASSMDSLTDSKNEHEDLDRHKSDKSELVSDYEISGKPMIRKRKKRRIKLEALGDAGDQSDCQIPVTPNRYVCSLCSKSFPTHQALGGHMSSHNKLKSIQTLNESVSADISAAEECGHYGIPTTQVDETEAVLAGSMHQCKICYKTFPTGQALGGHKRCHWTAPVELQSSQVTSPGEAKAQSGQATSAGEARQSNGRRILEFDLNELPAMEGEESVFCGRD